MRKQLHETALIDNYLLNTLSEPDRFLFETTLIVDQGLKVNMLYQRRAHYLVKWFGRQEKRKELELVFEHVMSDENFAGEITSIFPA